MRGRLTIALLFTFCGTGLAGSLFVSEASKVEQYTLAGVDDGEFGSGPTSAAAMVMDSQGNLFVGSLAATGKIYKFTPSGTRTTFATLANGVPVDPFGLAFDSAGDLLAVDREQDNVDVYSSTGTWEGELLSGYSMHSPDYLALDSSGDLFISNDNTGEVDEFSAAGVFIQKITQDLTTAYGIQFDAQGHLWVLDEFSSVIREYSISGSTYSEIGSRTLSNANPVDFAFDQNGDLYVLSIANGTKDGYLQSYLPNSNTPTKIATLSSADPGYLLDTSAIVATPEPGTVLLMALGILPITGRAFWRRVRRSRKPASDQPGYHRTASPAACAISAS